MANLRNPRHRRGALAQAFDAFTMAVFVTMTIITLLAASYVLANRVPQDAIAFGPMA